MQYIKAIRIGLVMTMSFVIQGPVLAESDYPAAYFEPIIVYQAPEIAGIALATIDSDASGEAAADAASEPEAVDPYPAANFQPVIVYQDKEWIAAHTQGQKAAGKPASAKAEVSVSKPKHSASTPPVGPITDDGGFPASVLFLLVALTSGFYWLMNMDKTTAAVEISTAESDEGEGDDAGESDDSTE